MSQPRKTWAIYAITRHGAAIATRLAEQLVDADVYASARVQALVAAHALPLPLPMGPLLADTFAAYDCHVFVISVGAVVRMVAPLLRDKKIDPAVVCVDDAARFSVCLLSGHVGRGNAFAEQVGAVLGAQPVITTASDVQGTLTVDILGRALGWVLDDANRNVTRGCAAVVNAAPVAFVQECGEPTWWDAGKPLPPGVSYHTALDEVVPEVYEMLLIASDRDVRATHPVHWDKAVVYRPKTLVLGLGCDKNTPVDLVARGVHGLLADCGLAQASLKALATIDKKADEPAFVALAARLGVPLVTYPAAALDGVAGVENPSEVVKKYVGTRSVAEAACLRAAGASALLVPKRSYTEPGAGRTMTLAVARVPFKKRDEGER